MMNRIYFGIYSVSVMFCGDKRYPIEIFVKMNGERVQMPRQTILAKAFIIHNRLRIIVYSRVIVQDAFKKLSSLNQTKVKNI